MVKSFDTIGRQLWPKERKIINYIMTKQKGFHNKPYPSKDKIPEDVYKSGAGALRLFDKVEKKKANKGHIMKYRRTHETTADLPAASENVRGKTIEPRSGTFKLARKGVVKGKAMTQRYRRGGVADAARKREAMSKLLGKKTLPAKKK